MHGHLPTDHAFSQVTIIVECGSVVVDCILIEFRLDAISCGSRPTGAFFYMYVVLPLQMATVRGHNLAQNAGPGAIPAPAPCFLRWPLHVQVQRHCAINGDLWAVLQGHVMRSQSDRELRSPGLYGKCESCNCYALWCSAASCALHRERRVSSTGLATPAGFKCTTLHCAWSTSQTRRCTLGT